MNQHMKLEEKFSGNTIPLWCGECESLTHHSCEPGESETVYRCQECGQETVRSGAIA